MNPNLVMILLLLLVTLLRQWPQTRATANKASALFRRLKEEGRDATDAEVAEFEEAALREAEEAAGFGKGPGPGAAGLLFLALLLGAQGALAACPAAAPVPYVAGADGAVSFCQPNANAQGQPLSPGELSYCVVKAGWGSPEQTAELRVNGVVAEQVYTVRFGAALEAGWANVACFNTKDEPGQSYASSVTWRGLQPPGRPRFVP